MKSQSQGKFAEKSDAIADARFAIVPLPHRLEESTMPIAPNLLADYVLKTMREKGLTFVEVERLSKKRGGTIGKSTVQQIALGKTPNPGILTLRDLSWGLGRPLDELTQAALGEIPEESAAFQKSEWAVLWEISTLLSLGDQRVVKRFLQMLEREIRRLLSSD